MPAESAIKKHLKQTSPMLFTIQAGAIAFFTYSCMYAFRKPFTAATFSGLTIGALEYKIACVFIQLLAYTLSKFLGIKVISEMLPARRRNAILLLLGISWLSLLGFAVVPAPFNLVFMFFNGFPLGLIWGLVFGYIEGRKTTEGMGAILSISFIFSSGFVKSTGKSLMNNFHVSEFWMPFLTATLFVIPVILFTWLLEQIPPPDDEDIRLRSERLPMTKKERTEFIRSFFPGIIMLVVTYVLLTVVRDFRDNFAADIWKELGVTNAAIFTTTEIPVSIAVLIGMSLFVIIRNNQKALLSNLILIAGGLVFVGLSTLLYEHRQISAEWWMICNGIGLYIGYIPFNCILFERLIAVARRPSNSGFLIYVADSFGYLGSLMVLIFRQLSTQHNDWQHFFIASLYLVCTIGCLLMAASFVYFNRKTNTLNG